MINASTFAKEVWLTYFNKTLYEQGIITEEERDKMSSLISSYCHNNKLKTNNLH